MFERLTPVNKDPILRLKAMSPEGLRDAVCKPLQLAGEVDDKANQALLEAVKSDLSNQSSDLPLLQVALRAAWQKHGATGRPMLECYHLVGRVSGALAKEADKAHDRLPPDDQARRESIFVRLVRLGDTGGATRRPASLDDFDPPRRALLQKLGEDDYGRLVSVGATHAELAHDALITQWPWLQGMLKTNTADVRRLARLMERAKEWSAAPDERKAGYLATGAEREAVGELARRRPDWLSQVDRDFVEESNRAFEIEREKEQRALEEQQRAFRVARHNESVALTALANVEASQENWVNAAKLALAAWPRDESDTMRPKLARPRRPQESCRSRSLRKVSDVSFILGPQATRLNRLSSGRRRLCPAGDAAGANEYISQDRAGGRVVLQGAVRTGVGGLSAIP